MANPIDTLKKIRGATWTELRSRSEQVFSAYTDQIGLSGKLPTDDEFTQLVDKSFFSNDKVTPESVYQKFFEISHNRFFPSFRQKDKTLELYRNLNPAGVSAILERAERITDGKFDLLGYQNLDFGEAFDWHFEPISGKHIPLKHWKQFDELSATETGDRKIVWELNRHQHFFTFGMAYMLSRDEIFAETFVNHIDSWMEQNPPGMGINWASSLEVAFRSSSFKRMS